MLLRRISNPKKREGGGEVNFPTIKVSNKLHLNFEQKCKMHPLSLIKIYFNFLILLSFN